MGKNNEKFGKKRTKAYYRKCGRNFRKQDRMLQCGMQVGTCNYALIYGFGCPVEWGGGGGVEHGEVLVHIPHPMFKLRECYTCSMTHLQVLQISMKLLLQMPPDIRTMLMSGEYSEIL